MSSRKKSRTWINSEDGPEESADDELLVFGYSCKVFRDEEKAAYIDEGKHLIPWMGDKTLLIDRYDGRGYLPNLREYEPSEEKEAAAAAAAAAAETLQEEDVHLEQLLDEERYMALTKCLNEEELYHEEEMKRLRAALIDEGAYNQVGFSYEEQQQMAAINGQKSAAAAEEDGGGGDADNGDQLDEENAAFVPHAELNVPEGMEVPSTAKINAIIEKTASFVSRQGPQMEIVIKAKQAKNPQFAFLAFDHPLNPYYKHMVQAMKAGKYVPRPQENASDDDDDSGDDHYLHPSLQASQSSLQVLNVPKLSYAPTGKDFYSMLVSQLKDKVFSGIQEPMQEAGRGAGNSTPPLSQSLPKPLMIVEPSPPPPPPGIAPVTLPQGGTMEVPDASFPPADLLPIVDKMASYVAKNGADFEAIVKSKGADDRFEFLKPGHRFHTYYQYKRKMYEKQLQIEKENLLKEAEDKEAKVDKVVSFSIKMKEPGEKRNALVMADGEGTNGLLVGPDGSGEPAVGSAENALPPEKEETAEQAMAKGPSQEAKLAEDRIRDRLAAAARERLVQVTREKQLQMERKRKAALFLTMLQRGGGSGKEEDADMIGPRLPNAAELEILVEDSEADLPLIPSFMNAPPPTSATSLVAGVAASSLLFQPHMLQPFAALAPMTLDPVTAAIQDKTVDALIRTHVSNSMKDSLPAASAVSAAAAALRSSNSSSSGLRHRHHHHHHHHRRKGRRGDSRGGSSGSRSRSRSGSRSSKSKSKRRTKRRSSRSRSRTRSRSRDRKNRKKSSGGGGRRSRSRSRSKSRRRHGGRRGGSTDKDEKTAAAATDRRKGSRTPPAAYSSPRKSDSPRRGGKSRSSKQRDRRSRSGSTSRRRRRGSRSRGKDSSASPPRTPKKKKTEDPSGSASASSNRPSGSPGKSRSRSRTRDSKR